MTTPSDGTSRPKLWAARILTAIVVLFLLFDSVTKLMLEQHVVAAMPALGWPVSLARPLGVILLTSLVLYVIPRTAVLGAILLTGYLGGAVATNLRLGLPLFSHTLFPVYIGVMVWGGLYLRDERLRALIPLRKT
jgi:hypothetical protein